MDQMGIDLTTIQNEEATPLLNDSKDDASPPKKRVKHASDSDSSKQGRVLDFDLPKLEPGLARQWYRLLYFQNYDPERAKKFQDLVTKFKEEVTALENVSDEADCFLQKVVEGLEEKVLGPESSEVIGTIRDGQRLVKNVMCEARIMLYSVEADVKFYAEYIDKIILKRTDALVSYMKKLEQLAEIPGVVEMIKYLKRSDVNSDQIKERSGLTLEDMSFFDTEGDEVGEEFGQSEANAVLNDNAQAFGELPVLRKAFERADFEAAGKLWSYEDDNRTHVSRLLHCFQSVAAHLQIMHQQAKLLHDKKVLVNGYYERFRFLHDWHAASATQSINGRAIVDRYF